MWEDSSSPSFFKVQTPSRIYSYWRSAVQEDWQMLLNVKKCKVLHIGHNNAYCDYSMNDEILQSVTEETDLGIIVSNDLKPSKQCVSAVKKANMTLGMIKRHIVSRDKITIVRLYKSLVRPKLEYCIQA